MGVRRVWGGCTAKKKESGTFCFQMFPFQRGAEWEPARDLQQSPMGRNWGVVVPPPAWKQMKLHTCSITTMLELVSGQHLSVGVGRVAKNINH